MIFQKLHPRMKAAFWLLSEADLFVSFAFLGGYDVPGPTVTAPGSPNHPPEALGNQVVPHLMSQIAATGFINSLFLGNSLDWLRIDLVKYFPSSFLKENGVWIQWKLLWRRKIKIKPAQLMLETFIRNPKLFSFLKQGRFC